MIDFQYPQLLYLLLLVPLIAVVFIYSRLKRRKQLQRFGRPDVIAALMPDASKYMPWVKLSLELVIVALVVLLMARPFDTSEASSGTDRKESSTSGIEIMLCVDVSNSMLASSTDDPMGMSRMQRTRLLLERLIDRLGNDKVGLILFAGDAVVQLPVTSDFISAKMFIDNVDPGMIPVQGTAIGAAIEMATNCLATESDFSKAIVVITDAENFEDDAISAAALAKRNKIRVDVIGVGTPQGAPIPNGSGGWFEYNGETVITKLNVDEARKIAEAGGGIYINGNASDAVNALTDNLEDMARTDYTRVSHSPAAEQFPLLAWIALVLLVVDQFVLPRKIAWLRRINFFSKKNADLK